MVKLAAARSSRMYGPRGREGLLEFLNALLYLAATLVLLGGLILLLPGFHLQSHPFAPLLILSLALCLIILVNVHDLFAQAAGIDFHLRLLAFDPQLALVEFGAPIFHIVGSVLLLIAAISMLKMTDFASGRRRYERGVRLLVAGSALWMLGSIFDACQVYERSNAVVQIFQKAVHIPLLMACTLYVVSSVMWMMSWPQFLQTTQYTPIVLAVFGSVLLVMGALANINRVIYLKRLVEAPHSPLSGSYRSLDPLRGGADEELQGMRREQLMRIPRQHREAAGASASGEAAAAAEQASVPTLVLPPVVTTRTTASMTTPPTTTTTVEDDVSFAVIR